MFCFEGEKKTREEKTYKISRLNNAPVKDRNTDGKFI